MPVTIVDKNINWGNCGSLLASASVVILTTLADANRTSMTHTYCVYTMLRYSWRWTVDMSETYRVLYQIHLRNSASRWLSVWEFNKLMSGVVIEVFPSGCGWFVVELSGRTYARVLAMLQFHKPHLRIVYWYDSHKRQQSFPIYCDFCVVGIVLLYIIYLGPASWSSSQGLWLLIMRSRVRFPVLPWEFFLAGKDSRGDHGLGS